ncbi:MAG: transcription elongation factor GreA [Propionibacteriaceae bacterium]|jgi:transcription elongation factor GreA|nr:transcription elongation factor GreA [Propionibacteriaceae bacterium]
MSEAVAVEWLSQSSYDKLRQEYEYLVDVRMDELAKKIGLAREEGDLSENAGYHAAREEQAQVAARIRELKSKLDSAQVGEAAVSDVVTPGMTVTVAFFDDPDDTDTFLLGSREMIGLDDSIDLPIYSPQSPLGAAVLGKASGDQVTYQAPNGKDISVTVLEFAPHN